MKKRGIQYFVESLIACEFTNFKAKLKEFEKKKTANINYDEILTIKNGCLTEIVNDNYGEMILPDTVKKIQKGVFEIVKIKRLVLPSSLRRIMNNNFENAVNVSEIVISEETEEIGKGVFIGAKGLKKVTVSGSVKFIGEKAFKDCTKLNFVRESKPLRKMPFQAVRLC